EAAAVPDVGTLQRKAELSEAGGDRRTGAGEVGGAAGGEGGVPGEGLGEVVVALGQHPFDEGGERGRGDRGEGGGPGGGLGGAGGRGPDAVLAEQVAELPRGVGGRVGDARGGAAGGVVGAGLVGHQGGDGGEVRVDPDRVPRGALVQGRVVGQRHLAHTALGQGGRGAFGEVGQSGQAPGLLAGGERGVAAADQDDLLGVGLVHRAGGEAVVGAHGGERGDGG